MFVSQIGQGLPEFIKQGGGIDFCRGDTLTTITGCCQRARLGSSIGNSFNSRSIAS
jgi:hypothetical protein